MKKKAFSLAEVLTTLMIVGVIASITMPVLYNSIRQEKARVTLKKMYSAYLINIQQILAGGTICRCADGTTAILGMTCADGSNADCAIGAICASLSCLRAWGNVNDTTKHNGILATATNFNFELRDGYIDEHTSVPADMQNHEFTSYRLPNMAGVAVMDYIGNNCRHEVGNGAAQFNACGIIIFDTNGTNGPNAPCQDRFAFYMADKPFGYVDAANHVNLSDTFLVPLGYDQAPNYGGDPYNCTAKYIYNNWKN